MIDILSNNLNERYSGSSAGNIFGDGIYFADDPGKSDHYSGYRGAVDRRYSAQTKVHQLLYDGTYAPAGAPAPAGEPAPARTRDRPLRRTVRPHAAGIGMQATSTTCLFAGWGLGFPRAPMAIVITRRGYLAATADVMGSGSSPSQQEYRVPCPVSVSKRGLNPRLQIPAPAHYIVPAPCALLGPRRAELPTLEHHSVRVLKNPMRYDEYVVFNNQFVRPLYLVAYKRHMVA